jgi:multidrug resistance efflux pump
MNTRHGAAAAALAIGVVATLGIAGCNTDRQPPPASEATVSATASATDGSLDAARPTDGGPGDEVARTVTADGRLVQELPAQNLSFTRGGTLLELLVAVGQAVVPGDVIARVESEGLELAVADARAGLAQAEAALSRLTEGATLETARLQVEQAKNQLWGTQSGRDAICGAYELGQKEGGIAKMAAPSSAECNSAQANVQAAEQAVQIAEAQLRAAEATADDELASAQAAVDRARLALAEALSATDDTVLTAPFTSTVTAVHLLPGVQVAPGAPVVTVTPHGPVRFVTSNLSERNLADVRVGAPATVTLSAYPDAPIAGTVERIDDQGTETPDGLVVFAVTIGLEETDVPLRAGLTGEVEIAAEGP